MKKAGIYVIESPTNKIYVGQSRNLHKRLLCYKRIDCKGQQGIYRSLLKYGPENHHFDVVCHFFPDVDQHVLDSYEIAIIKLFTDAGYEMLNIRGGGHNGSMSEEGKKRLSDLRKGVPREYFKGELNPYYGKKHSEETRKRMSEACKTNKLGTKNGRSRAIYQFDVNGNLIREWGTVTEAAKELKANRLAISDCLNGRLKTSAGYIWKYKL